MAKLDSSIGWAVLWQAGHLSRVGENDKKKKGILCSGLFGRIEIDLTAPVSGPECSLSSGALGTLGCLLSLLC